MTTEITSLTLGRMEYCAVFNHGKCNKNFQGTGSVEASLVDKYVDLTIWVQGSKPEENISAVVSLDVKALTAMIGQLQTMKAVLQERLEVTHVA